ncbi:hypothetical protein D3C81_1327200 [compost metagenome]
MLTHAEYIKTGLIRKLGCSNDLLKPLLRADPLPCMAVGHHVAQCINAEFKFGQFIVIYVVSHKYRPLIHQNGCYLYRLNLRIFYLGISCDYREYLGLRPLLGLDFFEFNCLSQ